MKINKKTTLLILTLAVIIFTTACSTEPKGINQPTNETTFGSLNNIAIGQDATPFVISELNQTTDNTIINIPQGNYTFYPDYASERLFIISNNDNGLYRVLFDLKGKKNITIDGNGSLLTFNGYMIPFNLEDSENITLRNFSIDWERPFHSEGKVVAVNKANKTFDIAITDQFPYRMEGDQLIWMEKWDVNEWSSKEWRQDIAINIFFDSKSKATVYRVNNHKMNPYHPLLHTQYKAEEIRKGLVRIHNSISELPEPGWIWVSKGKLKKSRQSPAIRILGSKNIRLENINIYHAGAMGIIGERSENIELDNVNVILPPGKDRIVSATADATHFVNCKGHISIKNSFFENMLDDATNIHGTYLKIIKSIDPKTIGVHAVHHEQNVQQWAAPGDTIVIRNNQTLEAYKKLVVKDYRMINHRYAEMEFYNETGDILPNSGVENPYWNPSFAMANCTVQNNRARSILLSSNREILIENNTFIRPMMAAISIAGDMNYWFESGNVNGLTIRNNHFIDGCTGNLNQAIITFEPIILNPELSENPFHSNVVIENNLFETFDNPILDIFSVNNLNFNNNTIRRTHTFEPLFPDKPAINIRHSKDIVISDNIFEREGQDQLHTDEKSAGSLKKVNNVNLIIKRNRD